MRNKSKNIKVFTKFDIIPLFLILSFSYALSKYIIPSIWKDFSLGDFASLYTFSALIQAFAALFALVGMFVIFKLQSIDNKMSAVEHQIIEYFRAKTNRVPTYGTVYDLRNDTINPSSDLDISTKQVLWAISKDGAWNKRFDELKELEKQKLKIKVEFLKPLALTIAVMLLGIASLPFSQNLHNNPTQELSWVLNIAGLAIWGLIEMTYYVISTLRA